MTSLNTPTKKTSTISVVDTTEPAPLPSTMTAPTKCPECGTTMQADASRCGYCGENRHGVDGRSRTEVETHIKAVAKKVTLRVKRITTVDGVTEGSIGVTMHNGITLECPTTKESERAVYCRVEDLALHLDDVRKRPGSDKLRDAIIDADFDATHDAVMALLTPTETAALLKRHQRAAGGFPN